MPLEEKAMYALLEHQKQVGDDVDSKIDSLKDDHKDRFHASDMPVEEHLSVTSTNGLATTLTTTYLKPPKEYLCPECQTFGQHYRDACYLWRNVGHKDIQVPFGPKKFGLFEAPKEDDAFHYSMMYKRSTR